MPIMAIKKNRKLIGYKYGKSGKLYTLQKYGKESAYQKAREQGQAIKISQLRRGR